jgi:hypothetical protein
MSRAFPRVLATELCKGPPKDFEIKLVLNNGRNKLSFSCPCMDILLFFLLAFSQVLHKPSTITQRRERSTQTTTTITGKQLIPTKYLNTEESQKPWRKCTSVRSPYMRGKICYKAEFEDGSVSFSEAFDPDDPSLIDRRQRILK